MATNNFQMPRTQLFFNLLLHSTKTSPIVGGCTQLIHINNNDKCHNMETHWQWIKWWSMDSSSPKHIEHLLATLKFLLSSISSIGIFPLVAAEVRKHALVETLDLQIAWGRKSSWVNYSTPLFFSIIPASQKSYVPWFLPLFQKTTLCTLTPFNRPILKRSKNWTLRGWSPHHTSCQNKTLNQPNSLSSKVSMRHHRITSIRH